MICRCCSESASTCPAAAAATTAATALRLRLLEVLLERANAQEIQVARRGLRAGRVVVRGARVVRHRIAGLDAELFEIERVAGGDLGQPRRPREQLHDFLRAAVHRVHELEVANAEIVFGRGLDEHFFDRRHRRIAARAD